MLTKKAKKFIKKYQQGNIVPGSNMYSTLADKPVPQEELGFLDEAIPYASPIAQTILGGIGLIQALQNKKKQKFYEKQSQESLKERKDLARVSNFYKTPYSYQVGGLINQVQQAEQIQAMKDLEELQNFQDFYNIQEQQQDQSLSDLQEHFKQKNEMKKQQWKQGLNQGIGNLVSGTVGIAQQALTGTGGFQQGGEIDSKTDLYSPDFDPKEFLGITENVKDEILIEDKESDTLLDWAFSNEDFLPEEVEINDDYFNPDSNDLPIAPVLSQLEEMGITPSSTVGGEHNPGSLHYQGKAIDLGLNTSFGGDTKKMDEFYEFLTSAEGKKRFPNLKVVDERTRPLNQKVWSGSHIHLEIL